MVVASDQMALGVLRALDEFNIKVPDQVAVVGFDGITDSAYFNPPLTTVKQDFTAIGEQCVIQAVDLKNQTVQYANSIQANSYTSRADCTQKQPSQNTSNLRQKGHSRAIETDSLRITLA